MAGYRKRRTKSRYLPGANHRQPAKAEGRGTFRLVICGGIFVVLVVLKLLFPQAVSGAAESVGELIGRDADFKAAFAAIGRAVSGEEEAGDSLQDAYTAVFHPETRIPAEPVSEKAQDPGTPPQWGAGVTFLHHVTPSLPAAVFFAASEASASAAVPTLPDNASLEQRNLGFPCSSPLVGTLTSAFGWRDHPVSGGNKFHYGIDLSGNMGDPICAFADGTVFATGESSTLGQYIMVRHEGDYMTLYAHCSRVTKLSGAVKRGEKIAEVGDSGAATGPHLHFELHCGSLYLNPIYYVELASY